MLNLPCNAFAFFGFALFLQSAIANDLGGDTLLGCPNDFVGLPTLACPIRPAL
jgi:hypothetical protein